MNSSSGASGSQPGRRRGQISNRRSASRARTPTLVNRERTRPAPTVSDTMPAGTSTAAFFPNADNARIRGGHFNIGQGPQTNLAIIVNPSTQHATAAVIVETQGPPTNIDIETPDQVARPLDISRRESWSTPSQQLRSCEVYYKQLLVKSRGSPLWVPAPNTMLPLTYQRQGISIGDVGIITEYGGFDFLFNIFLHRGDPKNPETLPEDFAPLDQPRGDDIRAYTDFRPNSYLASSSVTKSRRNDSDPSGLIFESQDEEAGAILTMPNGSNSKDLGNRMRIRRHTAINAERWYRYAHDVRGREVNNGDLRVVIGWDQSSTWGMAVFSKNTSQNTFRLKFKSNRHLSSDIGQCYDWECESGVFEGRTGPDTNELAALRAGEPEQPDAIYENQCLFVRTLNVKLNDDVWQKLISETDMGFVLNDLTDMKPSPSLTTPNSMTSSFAQEMPQSPRSLDSQPQFSKQSSTSPAPPQISRPPSALAIHPTNYILDKLLMNYPNAKMVIIEDDIWMSVLEQQDEEVMPEEEELYQRIMMNYSTVEEDGLIFLDSEEYNEGPPWAANEDSITQEEKIGTRPFHEIFRGIFAGRAVVIKKLVVAPFKSTFHRAMELWTELSHPNILSTYAGTTQHPFLYITPYMEGGTLVQFLKNLVSSKGPPPPQLQLCLPQPEPPDDDEILPEQDLLKMIYEIAHGMEYLHSQGILHGSLKAANILLDDNNSCIISDFGQTAMKKECGADIGEAITSHYGRTYDYVRWSSPELLRDGVLTEKADVWAFSLTCIEILTMGQLPWPLLDNDTVRQCILNQDSRPAIPLKTQIKFPAVQEIILACWRTSAHDRPSFMKVVPDIQQLRFGSSTQIGSPVDRSSWIVQSTPSSRNNAPSDPLTLRSVSQGAIEPSNTQAVINDRDIGPPLDQSAGHELHTDGDEDDEVDSFSEDELEIIRLFQIESRYRLLLTHRYSTSLILPLWTPSIVRIGAVGYLQKSTGRFVTLFNAFSPTAAKNLAVQNLHPLHGYDRVKAELTKAGKISLSKQMMRTTPASVSGTVSRVSFQLKRGAVSSCLHADDTEYHYMDSLDDAKKWLQDNNRKIFDIYQGEHKISLEEIVLVTGTLQTSHYALLVNYHPCPDNTEVVFKANQSPKIREPWGSFSFDRSFAACQATNVSKHGERSKAILIARLRIKPNSTVATAE